MNFKPIPEADLIRTGIEIATTIIDWGRLPLRRLIKQLSIRKVDYKDPNNVTRAFDASAHDYMVLTLRSRFDDQIMVYGEEARSTPKSLVHTRPTVAVVDALDGTDLVARGFSNWCCALAFIYPREQKILATVVGHISGDIYYASDKGAFKRTYSLTRKLGSETRLKRNSDEDLKLEEASICFYGQKPGNFLVVANDAIGLREKLQQFSDRIKGGESLPIRIYNFAGNPMMVKTSERTVDAVFELTGQKAHDVVPGAYIATKAGAVFTDLEGKPIDPAAALLNPNERLTYILAATQSLAAELKDALAKRAKPTTQQA